MLLWDFYFMRKTENPANQKLSFSQYLTKFSQFIYLSFSNSSDNILWESAAACSFGFIFSFVPVVLIILTVLISVLKVSPGMMNYVMEFCNQVKDVYDFRPLIQNVMQIEKFRFIDFFLGVWVIWMARKLFLSVVQGMYRIFRSATQRKKGFNQILTFISEFVIVITFISVILFSFIFNKFIHLPVFEQITTKFPKLFNTSSNILVSAVTYILFFIFTLYCYKFVSGTKPSFGLSFFYAFLSTATTFVVSFFLNKFMNYVNYSVVYGTISTLVIMLFKVYLFFVVFLFCAQMIYVSQFFDNLIIAQIYTLPNSKKGLLEKWYASKFLFKSPALFNTATEAADASKGDSIYSIGEPSNKVYYIRKGTVVETQGETTVIHKAGDFFGELDIVLNQPRSTNAVAKEKCIFMVIDGTLFNEIEHQNPLVSSETVSRLNTFNL